MTEEYTPFFKVFAQVSKAIHSGENTVEILDTIVTNIKEILGAKGCIYWIVDHEQRKIETMISAGFPYRNLFDVDYAALSRIFDPAEGGRVYIEDARTDRRIPELDTIGKKSVGSIVGLFFDIIGAWSGILAVYFHNRRVLTVSEQEILTGLGEQGAIALHKSLSYDEKMMQSLRQMVEAFTLALEAKDESTHGHSVQVARFARSTATELGLSEKEVETVYHGGLLHDIGKIGMQDDILERLGILSRQEMDIVRKHPVIGARITQPLVFLNDVAPLILHHHERFDGSGYPDGLKGEAIPLGARILTVCDAFETMIAGRRHFARMNLADAVVNLHRGAGRQFDPLIVNALFAALLRRSDLLPSPLSGSARHCLQKYQDKLNRRPGPEPGLFI